MNDTAGDNVVVGAAIVHPADPGRVLAARRSAPPELAGGWEFPGGKVEPGEGEAEALVRECHEELGIRVRAGEPLPGAWPLARGYVLRVWTAEMLDDTEPRPLQDHSELRWVDADEADRLAWLPQDREAAALVSALLRPPTHGLRPR